ncbi:MAG: hypothetical protein AB1441_04290 [Bacillota bacterium]
MARLQLIVKNRLNISGLKPRDFYSEMLHHLVETPPFPGQGQVLTTLAVRNGPSNYVGSNILCLIPHINIEMLKGYDVPKKVKRL